MTNPQSKKITWSRTAVIALISLIVLLGICAFGEGALGHLALNGACYKYIGCTDGFFGYDAIEHFFYGVTGTCILAWIFETFPRYSMLHTERWKSILAFITIVVFVSVLWEFGECAHDYFRVDILHESLVNFRLHIDSLDQPTNLDTMGDLAFGLLGAIVALFFTKIKNPHSSSVKVK
jgi:hypothetical protein